MVGDCTLRFVEVLAIAFAVLVVVAFLALRPRPDVSGDEARALVAAGARLIDVRSAEEFAAGHVAGATNVPVAEIAARASEIGVADSKVVVYCATGVRSARAAQILRSRGWTDVHDLGGMKRW